MLYDGTKYVNESKINMLIKEYELFHMQPSEIVESMQMHFLHIINKLENLDKYLSNQDCANKILRSMCSE